MKVGINENVGISAKKGDYQGALNLQLVFTQLSGEQEEDLFAALNEASYEVDGDVTTVTVYPLQLSGYEGGQKVDTKSPAALVQDIQDLKALFTYVLSQFTTTNNIKWDMFAGSDMTQDNYKDILFTAEGLNSVYTALVNQFVEQMEEYGDPEKKFRVLFVRSSKAKHYPNVRRKYLSTNGFIESMDIPADQSKLKFSAGEIKAGLDNGEPVVEGQSAGDKDLSGSLDATGL